MPKKKTTQRVKKQSTARKLFLMVRVHDFEKKAIEMKAEKEGFEDVSDMVRKLLIRTSYE